MYNWFLLVILLTTVAWTYPLTPNKDISPGHLCSKSDSDFKEYRYKEKIPYCVRNVSYETKSKVYHIYNISEKERKQYTIDHIIPLSIGGSNSIGNLWPEHYQVKATRPNLEYNLYKKLKYGKITQKEAIRTIILEKFAFILKDSKNKKPWTVYIHLNADNNLCYFSKKDINEIKTMDVTKNANIIVGFDCSRPNDSRLIEIQGDKEIDLIPTGFEFDMGDITFFKSIVNAVFENYPSEKRMVVIWNHGDGWYLKQKEEIDMTGISYDDQSGNHFSIKQIEQALREITRNYKIDILGFDACLMQMIEVVYEIGTLVDFTIASEETEPGNGWDYRGVVAALAENASPQDLGKSIIDYFMEFYKAQKVTLSLVDNKKVVDFVKKTLAPEVENIIKVPNLKDVINNTYSYSIYSFKDLGLFFQGLPEELGTKLYESYQKTIIYNRHSKPATGMSVYLTLLPYQEYLDLKFSKDTQWHKIFGAM